jgi:hypothetical protein
MFQGNLLFYVKTQKKWQKKNQVKMSVEKIKLEDKFLSSNPILYALY